MPEQVRVVIADGFEIVREGIAARLQETEGLIVVGQASDGFSALKLCRTLQPDIILMDLALARPTCLETLAKIRKSCPDTKVVISSSNDSFNSALSILAKGATSFVPRQAKGTDFVRATIAAANGFLYLPEKFASDLVQSRQNISRTGNCFGLSPRELQILSACTSGQSNKEVAHSLDISTRTVETHRNNIYRKTACKDLQELIEIAHVTGADVADAAIS